MLVSYITTKNNNTTSKSILIQEAVQSLCKIFTAHSTHSNYSNEVQTIVILQALQHITVY